MMDPSTTLFTMVTAAPYFHKDMLLKRAGSATCGDLQGKYPNIQAPICTGQTSICTFDNGYQGCCDSSGSCELFTTCNGPYATDACTESSCLNCPQSAPYCVKYNFDGPRAGQAYEGYSCADLDFGSLTIYGLASTITGTVNVTSSSTSSGPQSTASSSSSTISISHITSSSSFATSTSPPAPTPTPKSHTGAIVGGVVGGLVGLAVLAIGSWFLYRHLQKGDGRGTPEPIPEAQQDYNENNMTGIHPYGYVQRS